MAAEKGRDWWSVAIGLVAVAIASGLLWSWLDGSPSPMGPALGPVWLVGIAAVAVIILILGTKYTSAGHR